MTEKPTKKETDIFKAIKEDDFEEVKRLVEWQPELVRAVAPKKPAETMGMSPLQVALNTGWHREIAWFLLENGADVNYMAGPEYKLYGAVWGIRCCSMRFVRQYGTHGVMFRTQRQKSSAGVIQRKRPTFRSVF